MPNKHNIAGRHHIPKMKFKISNWSEYEAGLRRRGSLTLWVTDEAVLNWSALRRTTPGGQALYSDLTIETGMMLRLAFHLPLRQVEGFMTSIFSLMEVAITAPDHTTLSRRAACLPSIAIEKLPDGPLDLVIDSTGVKIYGAGEWLQEKHKVRARRTWRKLHLAIDANTGMIVASILTDTEAGDPSQVGPLLDRTEGEIGSVTADGAYDGAPTYATIAARGEQIKVVIPPRADAVLSEQADVSPSRRDGHIAMIAAKGRLGWQEETGYGRRALVETTMGRYKTIIGPTLRARCLPGQRTKAAIGVAVLNRMLLAGRPKSARITQENS